MPKVSVSLAAQLHLEKQLDPKKYRYVVGVDEVGRGSWAGPLCVGAVVYDLKQLVAFMSELDPAGAARIGQFGRSDYLRVDDSKKLSARVRNSLVEPITALAKDYGLGMVESDEVDEIGMTSSLALGLDRAIRPLQSYLDSAVLMLDGTTNFSRYRDAVTVAKGDAKSFAIATASILAKVARDSLMESESHQYPWYCFEKNKGYPSRVHVSALYAMGPCRIHRRSWSFMGDLPWYADRKQLPRSMAVSGALWLA